MDQALPSVPKKEFVPVPPIDVPPSAPKYHPYFRQMLGPFLTVLILGIITLGSAGLLYQKRQQNISPSAPSRSSAYGSPVPTTPGLPFTLQNIWAQLVLLLKLWLRADR